MRSVLVAGTNVPARVVLEGTAVAQPDSWILYVRDATGAVPVFNRTRKPLDWFKRDAAHNDDRFFA
ncbi:MAG: hypothetical protein ACI4RD_00505 [Kiritimatiellia bacterium]